VREDEHSRAGVERKRVASSDNPLNTYYASLWTNILHPKDDFLADKILSMFLWNTKTTP